MQCESAERNLVFGEWIKRLCRFHSGNRLLDRLVQILDRGTLFEQAALGSVVLRHLEQVRMWQVCQHDDGYSGGAAVRNKLEQNMKP